MTQLLSSLNPFFSNHAQATKKSCRPPEISKNIAPSSILTRPCKASRLPRSLGTGLEAGEAVKLHRLGWILSSTSWFGQWRRNTGSLFEWLHSEVAHIEKTSKYNVILKKEKSGPMPSKKNMFSIYLPALVILQINTHKIFKHCVMEDKPLQQSSPALVHHLATTDTSTRTTLKPFTCIHMSAYPGISQNPPNPIVESCSTKDF